MDANTLEAIRVIAAAAFGIVVFGALIWGMVKAVTRGMGHGFSVQLPEQPMWTYHKTWSDDDLDDYLYDEDDLDWEEERQDLRDRLAAALWQIRQLKRTQQLDDQVTWRLNDIERKLATWEADS